MQPLISRKLSNCAPGALHVKLSATVLDLTSLVRVSK